MAEGRNSSIYTSLSSSVVGFHRRCRDNLVQVLGWCRLAELCRLDRGSAKLCCFRSQEINHNNIESTFHLRISK